MFNTNQNLQNKLLKTKLDRIYRKDLILYQPKEKNKQPIKFLQIEK
jgi:hypothetical protein